MVTMAKGFGNGAAIGAVLMKSEDAKSLEGKSYFNTFGGDPMQSAQAKATMDIIAEEKLSENAIAMGARLVDGFKQMMSKHEMIGDVRGRGLLLGVELVKDRKSKEHASAEAARLMDTCKDHGVLLGKGGLYGNVIRIAPPMTINAEQVDHLLEVVDRALAEVGR
jgi:4-aminobutyrate aminotransferase-like enzyme